MTTNRSAQFWRSITLVVRLDMVAAILGAAALLLWLSWH
jgi:hypothetical protein